MSGSHRRKFWGILGTCGDPHRRHVADYNSDDSFDYIRLISGMPFAGDWPASLQLILEGGKSPVADYLCNPMGICVVSRRFMETVRGLLGRFELLPAPLFEANGVPVEGCWVLNVLDVRDCLDVAASVTSEHDGEVLINEYHLIAERIPVGAHIFRVLEPGGFVTSQLFVSHEFAKCLEGKHFGIPLLPICVS